MSCDLLCAGSCSRKGYTQFLSLFALRRGKASSSEPLSAQHATSFCVCVPRKINSVPGDEFLLENVLIDIAGGTDNVFSIDDFDELEGTGVA